MDARGVRRGGPARLLARRACSALAALTVLLPAAAQDSSAWTRYRERKAAWTAGLPGAEDDFLDFHDRLATEVARDAGQLAESLAPLASLGFAEFSFRGRCERAAELWERLDAIGVERRSGDSALALRLAGGAPVVLEDSLQNPGVGRPAEADPRRGLDPPKLLFERPVEGPPPHPLGVDQGSVHVEQQQLHVFPSRRSASGGDPVAPVDTLQGEFYS